MDVVYAIKFNVVNKYVEVVTGACAPVLRMIQSDGTVPNRIPRKLAHFPSSIGHLICSPSSATRSLCV